VLIFFVVIVGIIYLSFAARRHLFKTPHNSSPGQAHTNSLVNASSVSVTSYAPSVGSASVNVPVQDTNQVMCLGFSYDGRNGVAWFSDGRVAYSDEHEIQWFRKHTVKAFGQEFPIARNAVPFSSYTPAEIHPVIKQNILPDETGYQPGTVQVIPFSDSRQRLYPSSHTSGFASMPQNSRSSQIQPQNENSQPDVPTGY
jgi:hypothetical protein